MTNRKKRIIFRETVHCSWPVLMVVSLASTMVVDLMIFLIWGRPQMTINAISWIMLFSAGVFLIAFLYSGIRYSVKIKVFRSVLDDRIYLSLRGVGKGTWMQIPVESVVACKQAVYSMPFGNLFRLLATSNVSFKRGGSPFFVYPLPGWKGSGMQLEYRTQEGVNGNIRHLLVPTQRPLDLCDVLTQAKSE